jgi:hypothetical protein
MALAPGSQYGIVYPLLSAYLDDPPILEATRGHAIAEWRDRVLAAGHTVAGEPTAKLLRPATVNGQRFAFTLYDDDGEPVEVPAEPAWLIKGPVV